MFRIIVCLIVCCVVTQAAESVRTQHPLGIGVAAGEPTGLTVAYHLSDGNTLSSTIGWSFESEDNFAFHIDDTFNIKEGIFNTERLDLYVGAGFRYKELKDDKDLYGIRFPVGLNFCLEGERFEFFGEGAPILDVYPSSKLRFNAALGFRLFF